MKNLKNYKLIFWDFDGVIKESNELKGVAFVDLFDDCNIEIKQRIIEHHRSNGGVSRFVKIPLYLSWVGISSDANIVNYYATKFSSLTIRRVVESAWVVGVREYIQSNCNKQIFILVTATPQKEIEEILKILKINQFFYKYYGTPAQKEDVIMQELNELKIDHSEAIMIGDSKVDLNAALKNNIQFLLRRHDGNKKDFVGYTGLSFEQIGKYESSEQDKGYTRFT